MTLNNLDTIFFVKPAERLLFAKTEIKKILNSDDEIPEIIKNPESQRYKPQAKNVFLG